MKDPSIRPNQVLAISLEHTMLPNKKAKRVMSVVERDLLTPYGLRSLAPSDPQYCGKYEGNPSRRDGAYHQGTVWAWLIGPFISAYIKVNGGDPKRFLEPFVQHLKEAGLGQVSEIFDGDAPHTPRGCIAQAWSVAEVLRSAATFRHTPRRLT